MLCDSPHAQPLIGALFFVSFVLTGTMIILNLFIGVIMSGMDEAQAEAEQLAREQFGDGRPSSRRSRPCRASSRPSTPGSPRSPAWPSSKSEAYSLTGIVAHKIPNQISGARLMLSPRRRSVSAPSLLPRYWWLNSRPRMPHRPSKARPWRRP